MQGIKCKTIFSAMLICLSVVCCVTVLAAYENPAGGIVWVLDFKSGDDAELIKFDTASNIELSRKGGFNRSKDLEVYARDGSVWVTDTANNQAVKVSSDGRTELAKFQEFDFPMHSSVSQEDGVLWVADEGHSEMVKVSADGSEELLRITGFTKPHDIQVSAYDGSVWLLDSDGGRIIKFSSTGKILGQVGGLGALRHFTVSSFDGSCWAVKTEGGLVKISSGGAKKLVDNSDVRGLELSVNPVDGSCWVADSKAGVLYNIASDGKTELLKLENLLKAPIAISPIDPLDGSFWVGDSGRGEIIKLSASGKELKKIIGFLVPVQVIEVK
ncbi:MAG: hypothetical protein COV72_08055 [Candidatus Omnitrophica bacterium CG11_big_fil_rev_8_21_14_0_20_42_13]|uniref:SMP-30/Gluconolactonase/LRE-like region domain-containing protein n=1 Tax=Candidatus Ghiorseimicrobium undicola TaxID=1974746 RepID=A0A2H0LXR5_9BACT|nr:MAG: hypothetical protein COV72_08055 [Candidatus Omnitrophica bacterium CG11_big_fil_rev_8_21_14_0_20_42_13]